MKTWYRLILILSILTVILTTLGQPAQTAAQAPAGPESASPQMRSANFSGAIANNLFDQSGYLLVSANPAFNYNGGGITLETWVKRANTNRIESLIGNGRSANLWLGISAAGKISFSPAGIASLMDGSAVIPVNTWTHIAVVYQSNLARAYYINGVPDKLDTTPANNPGLANGSITQQLEIASDRDNMANVYNFTGQLDEVRIWSISRSASDVMGDMTTMITGAKTGLAGAWELDGSNSDITGINTTVPHGTGITYLTDGALPRSLSIPQVTSTMTLDGVCAPSEYTGSADVGTGDTVISVQHTATDLWICLYNTHTPISTQIYLDPLFTKLNPPQAEHIVLTLPNSAAPGFASIGDGAGGLIAAPGFDSHWDGAATTNSAEFSISSDLLGGWEHQMGLGVAINTSPISSWPSLMNAQRPITWAPVSLLGNSPSRTFNGSVVYHPVSTSATDQVISGMTINLIGYDGSGNEATMTSSQTNSSGQFSLVTTDGYANHRIEAGTPPKGMQFASSIAGTNGTSLDAHTIDFGAVGAGTYSDNIFKLSDATPRAVDTSFGPLFLVVATQPMLSSGALDDFIAYKARLGFTMTTASIESIETTYTTGNRQDRIRAYEQSLYATYSSRFQYALFVGSTDKTMPPAHLWSYSTYMDKTLCADPTQKGFRYSDWYFVDLVSNFDSNKNGCLMDGSWTSAPSAGYIRDTAPWFRRDVAVGRVPFDDAPTVRKVLNNSMDFERQAQSYKTKALLAMSQLAMKGYDANGVPCGAWTINHCATPNTTTNFDMSVLGDKIKKDIFDQLNNYSVKAYYENDSAISGGVPIQGSLTIDPFLIMDDIHSNLYGYVNFDGHGNSAGVYRVHWTSDLNGNGKPNYPAEMGTGDIFTTLLASNIYPKNGQGGIYYLSACNNAAPSNQSNLAHTLLNDGVGVASIAAFNIITVAPWDKLANDGMAQNTDYRVTQAIMTKNLRLGDALWKDLSDEYSSRDTSLSGLGSGIIGMALFGDPTLSYQGNPGAGAAMAPWSMARRESTGQAYFPLPGPQIPNKLWQFQGAPVTPEIGRPAPVVAANGDVIVPSGNGLSVLVNGALYQTIPFDSGYVNYGTPALATDGTVYAADSMGNLYAYTVNSTPPGTHFRSERWKISLGGLTGLTLTNPTISPDGSILIAYKSHYDGFSNIAVIRPDGNRQTTYTMLGTEPQTAISVGADRSIYMATAQPTESKGYVRRFDPYCNNSLLNCNGAAYVDQTALMSSAPLLANTFVYVGDKAGKLFQLDRDLKLVNTYNIGSQITAGPVSGPGGQVLVGTIDGKVISLTSNLALRWTRNFGSGAQITSVPAFSDDGLYLTAGSYLYALNPTSGATLWKRTQTSAGSVAVGYGRQIYLLDATGKVTAYGESWVPPVSNISAVASKLDIRPRNVISWTFDVPALASVTPNALQTATGLMLERSIDGKAWEFVALLPPGTTSYFDNGVTPEAGYQYRIQVIDSSGDTSDYANSESIEVLPLPPTAPVLDSVTPLSSTEIQLSWSAPTNSQVSNYRIDTATDVAGPFTALTTLTQASLSYVDSGLTPGSTHYYRVAAINANNSGAPSSVLGGTTFTQGLSAPTNPAAALQPDSTIHVTWAGRPAGAKAVVEVEVFGSGDYQVLGTVDADSLDYTPGEATVYDFRIRFVQGTQDSPYATTSGVEINQVHNYVLYLPNLFKP